MDDLQHASAGVCSCRRPRRPGPRALSARRPSRGADPHDPLSRGPRRHWKWDPRPGHFCRFRLQPHAAGHRGTGVVCDRGSRERLRGRRPQRGHESPDDHAPTRIRHVHDPVAARDRQRDVPEPGCDLVDLGHGDARARDRDAANRDQLRRDHVSHPGTRAGSRRHDLLPDHGFRAGAPGPRRSRPERGACRGVLGWGLLHGRDGLPTHPLLRPSRRRTYSHGPAGRRRRPGVEPGRVRLGHIPDPVCGDRRHQPLPLDHTDRPRGRDLRRVVLPRLGSQYSRDALRPNPGEERVRPHKSAATSVAEARPRSITLTLFALASLLGVSLSSSPVAAAAPTVTIVSPTDGSVIANGTPVLVLFAVSNFAFVQPGRVGQIGSPNEGHANVFLDAQYVRLLTDVEPFSLSLTSGAHTIRIRLVADNGTALNPDVSASVNVVATQGPGGGVPRVDILSPTPFESTGHGIYVSYRIQNFTLVEPRGQPNAPNEGHVQLLVERKVVLEVVQYEPVLLVSLPEGDITIGVRLANNDDTVLANPSASATVPIHVVASSAVSLPLVSNGGVALLLAFILIVLILRRPKLAAPEADARGGEPFPDARGWGREARGLSPLPAV